MDLPPLSVVQAIYAKPQGIGLGNSGPLLKQMELKYNCFYHLTCHHDLTTQSLTQIFNELYQHYHHVLGNSGPLAHASAFVTALTQGWTNHHPANVLSSPDAQLIGGGGLRQSLRKLLLVATRCYHTLTSRSLTLHVLVAIRLLPRVHYPSTLPCSPNLSFPPYTYPTKH